MAENHQVAFQWVIEARLRGAEVVHVDPCFTRTSANVTRHIPIRARTDIALLGGLIRHVVESESYFSDYVVACTNAATNRERPLPRHRRPGRPLLRVGA